MPELGAGDILRRGGKAGARFIASSFGDSFAQTRQKAASFLPKPPAGIPAEHNALSSWFENARQKSRAALKTGEKMLGRNQGIAAAGYALTFTSDLGLSTLEKMALDGVATGQLLGNFAKAPFDETIKMTKGVFTFAVALASPHTRSAVLHGLYDMGIKPYLDRQHIAQGLGYLLGSVAMCAMPIGADKLREVGRAGRLAEEAEEVSNALSKTVKLAEKGLQKSIDASHERVMKVYDGAMEAIKGHSKGTLLGSMKPAERIAIGTYVRSKIQGYLSIEGNPVTYMEGLAKAEKEALRAIESAKERIKNPASIVDNIVSARSEVKAGNLIETKTHAPVTTQLTAQSSETLVDATQPNIRKIFSVIIGRTSIETAAIKDKNLGLKILQLRDMISNFHSEINDAAQGRLAYLQAAKLLGHSCNNYQREHAWQMWVYIRKRIAALYYCSPAKLESELDEIQLLSRKAKNPIIRSINYTYDQLHLSQFKTRLPYAVGGRSGYNSSQYDKIRKLIMAEDETVSLRLAINPDGYKRRQLEEALRDFIGYIQDVAQRKLRTSFFSNTSNNSQELMDLWKSTRRLAYESLRDSEVNADIMETVLQNSRSRLMQMIETADEHTLKQIVKLKYLVSGGSQRFKL